jgi:multisubunit Na+/H+ antiporter MnhG subunit
MKLDLFIQILINFISKYWLLVLIISPIMIIIGAILCVEVDFELEGRKAILFVIGAILILTGAIGLVLFNNYFGLSFIKHIIFK